MKRKALIIFNAVVIIAILAGIIFSTNVNRTRYSIAQSIRLAENSEKDAELVATANNLKLKKGDETTVKLSVENIHLGEDGLNSIVGYLSWNEDIFDEVAVREIGDWHFEQNRDKNHRLYGKFVAYTMSEGVKENQDIVEITLKLKENVEPQITEVSLTGVKSSEGDMAVNCVYNDIEIEIVKDEEAGENGGESGENGNESGENGSESGENEENDKEDGEASEDSLGEGRKAFSLKTGDVVICFVMLLIKAIIVIGVVAVKRKKSGSTVVIGNKQKKMMLFAALAISIILLITTITTFAHSDEINSMVNNLNKNESLLNSSDYLVTDDTVSRIMPNTSVTDFIAKFNKDVNVYAGYPEAEVTDGVVTTGMRVSDGEDSYATVVAGDLNGDAECDQVDMSKVIRHIVNGEKYAFDELEQMAADINCDEIIDKNDIEAFVRYILYGEIELPLVNNVQAPKIEVVRGTYNQVIDAYEDDVLVKVSKQGENTSRIMYKIEGTDSKEYAEIVDGGVVEFKNDGAYKVSAYSYGAQGNRSAIVYEIIVKANAENTYKVTTRMEKADGTYQETTEEKTGKIGATVTCGDNIPEGYEINNAESTLSGTVQEGEVTELVLTLDRKSYNIKISAGDHVSSVRFGDEENQSEVTKSIKFGKNVNISAELETQEGYTINFERWVSNDRNVMTDISSKDAQFEMPMSNIELTAIATKNNNEDTAYTVEYYYQTNGTYGEVADETKQRSGETGATVEVTETDKLATRTGYVCDLSKDSDFSGAIKGDGTLKLKVYFKQQFTVTYNAGDHGKFKNGEEYTTQENYENIDYGTATPELQGVITADSGYTFVGWNEEIAETVTENKSYTATYTANEIEFNGATLSEGVFGTEYVSEVFEPASNGSDSYSYAIKEGAPAGASIDGENGANRKLVFVNVTPAGTYNVVVTATDTVTGKTKDATFVVTINKQQVIGVTGLNVATDGTVTWTNSSNATGYEISLDGTNYVPATNGCNHLDAITETAGTKTIYVRAINSDNTNYETVDASAVSTEITVCVLTVESSNTDYGTVDQTSYNVISGATYETNNNELIIKSGTQELKRFTAELKELTGYETTFGGWSSENGTISEDTNITANFARLGNTYYIAFDANGGNGEMPNFQMTYGEEKDLPENGFTKDGYTFVGWSKSQNGGVEYDDGKSVCNMATGGTLYLYAVWQANPDTVYHVYHYLENVNSEDSSNPNNYTLEEDEILNGTTDTEAVVVPKEYKGFLYDNNNVNNRKEDTIHGDGNTVLELYYTRKSYEIKLAKDEYITEVTGAGIYKYGAPVTINAVLDENVGSTIKFAKWQSNHIDVLPEITTAQASFTMPAGDVILRAKLNYGQRVNYSVDVNGQTLNNWKLFLKEDDGYAYMIYGDYLPNTAIPSEAIDAGSLSVGGTYRVWSIQDLSALLDSLKTTEYWNSYITDELRILAQNVGKTATATGTPTVQLFKKSWNDQYTMIQGQVNFAGDDTNGWAGHSLTDTVGYTVDENSNLYFPHKAVLSDGGVNCEGYILASMFDENHNRSLYIGYDGQTYNTGYANKDGSIRPLIKIPSALLELSEDGTEWNINYTSLVHEITLNNKEATTAGTTSIYEKYSVGFYLQNNNGTLSNQMTATENGITIPEKNGFTFGGYYTEENGAGTKYIDENGKLTSLAVATNFSEAGTLYAKWIPNELTFENQTINKTYSTGAQTASVMPANGGTGTYTYAKVSGDNDITVSEDGAITILANKAANVEGYTVVISATDSTTHATKSATYTIVIGKQTVNSVTDLAVAADGKVTWTNSSNATGYEISLDRENYTAFTNGSNYFDALTVTPGTKTIYVRATNSDNSNYETTNDSEVSVNVNVFSVLAESNNTNYGTVNPALFYVISGTTYEASQNTVVIKAVDTTLGTITATKIDADGYVTSFAGWSSTGGTVNSDMTISASFTRAVKTYTVTLNANGGTIPETSGWTVASGSETATKTVEYNSTYGTLPTPTKAESEFKGWSILPNEYQQVEYIESNGSQYINTGIEAKGSIGFSIKYQIYNPIAIDPCAAVFGGRYGRQDRELQLNTYADYNTGVFRYSRGAYPANMLSGQVNEISYIGNKYNANGVVQNIERETFDSGYNIYIFAVNKSGEISELSSMKLYSYKLYNGDILVRDYVPCYRKSDNVAGLYDTVNGTFNTNVGGANFEVGDVVGFVASTDTIQNKNHTLYAVWNGKKEYHVQYYQENVDSDDSSNPENYTMASDIVGNDFEGTSITATPEEYVGFTFDENNANNLLEGTLTDNNLVLKLYYKRNSYTLTLTKDDYIDTVTGAGTYKYGAPVTINAVLDANLGSTFKFAKWQSSDTELVAEQSTAEASFTMPAGDVSLRAKLNYGQNVNYSVDVNGQTLNNWKIFLKEDDGYTYLIYGGYLPNSAIPTVAETNGNLAKSGDYRIWTNGGSRDILLNAMRTTDYWEELITDNLKLLAQNEGKIITAMGGPSMELYKNSWNNQYTKAQGQIDVNGDDTNGWPNPGTVRKSVVISGPEDNIYLYYPYFGTSTDCEWYWIYSPHNTNNSALVTSWMESDSVGLGWGEFAFQQCATRPVIKLPSDFLELSEDGTEWNIKELPKYHVQHYIENVDSIDSSNPDNYTMVEDEAITGVPLTQVTANNKNYAGFTYDENNGNNITSGTVTEDGSLVLKLYYTRNSYTLTLTKDEYIDTVTGAGTYKYGAPVTINAVLDANLGSTFKFAKWQSSDTELVAEQSTAEASFTMPASDISLRAKLNYGQNVNYSVTVNEQTIDKWKLFLKDDDGYAYLITGDYIPNAAIPSEAITAGNLTTGGTYRVWSNSRDKLINSMKNTEYWKAYINDDLSTLLQNEGKTATVTGGATMTQFIESWNGQYTQAQGQVTVTGDETNGWTTQTMTDTEGYNVAEENNMYFPHKQPISDGSECGGYWLASISSVDSIAIQQAKSNSSRKGIGWGQFGYLESAMRPLIKIPASLLELSEDGTSWDIKYPESTVEVTFDANGGKINDNNQEYDSINRNYSLGDTYGELPTPTRDGYIFDGWYVAKLDEVPDEYTRVEYIESNGNQYMDTGVVPGSNTKVEFDFALTSLDYNSANGWGSSGSKESFLWKLYAESKQFAMSVSDDWTRIYLDNVDCERHKIELQSGTQTFDGEVVGNGTISNTAQAGETMYLSAIHIEGDTNPDNYAYQKIYSAKIWNGSTLIRNYIPCVRNSDNVAGLYEAVSGTFVRSATSTDFIAGSTFEKITPTTQLTIDSDCTLYAAWKSKSEYHVQYYQENVDSDDSSNSENYTMVSDIVGNDDVGTHITVTPEEYEGFTFDENNANNLLEGTLADNNLVLKLYYKRNSYTLTLTKDDYIDTVTGAGTYKYGAAVTVNATLDANAGSTIKFAKWQSSNTELVAEQSTAEASFTMPAGDVSLRAKLNYGQKVNYSVDVNGQTLNDWELFLKEDDGYAYMIYGDFLPNTAIPQAAITAGNLGTSGTYGVYSNTNRDYLKNAMLNTELWSSYITSDLEQAAINEGKNATATGGATMTQFKTSWNNQYTAAQGQVTIAGSEENGYETQFLNRSEGYAVDEENNMYFPHKSVFDAGGTTVWGYWLATKRASDELRLNWIYNLGTIDVSQYRLYYLVFRPLIRVPTSILELSSDGNSWDIKYAEPTVDVIFDANGGKINDNNQEYDSINRNYSLGDTYGELPTPTRDGYTFLGWKKIFLPKDYQCVEFVKFTGTQYIDTGIIPNNHMTEIKFDFVSTDRTKMLFGTESGLGYYYFSENKSHGKYIWGTSGTETGAGTLSTGVSNLIYNDENGSVILNGTTLGTGYEITSSTNLLLGERDTNGTERFDGRIYEVKVTDKSTGKLVRYMVPCYRKSDNEIGFYDLISGGFYTNQGTGTFDKGADEYKEYGEYITPSTQIDDEKNYTVFAIWEGDKTVTLNANGGIIPETIGWTLSNEGETATRTFVYNSQYGTLPTPTKTGCTFVGWNKEITPYCFPDEYQQTEYIEFTGTQYIDTGIIPNNHMTEIKFDFVSTDRTKMLFGTESGLGYYYFSENSYHKKYIWGTNGSEIKAGTISTGISNLIYNDENGSVILNGTTLGTGDEITSSTNLLLGERDTNGTERFDGRIYEVKVTDKSTGKLVRYMIPCYRKSDNEIGFYDLISGGFYTNQGTGTFGKGADEYKNYGEYITSTTTVNKDIILYAQWNYNEDEENITVTFDANGGKINDNNQEYDSINRNYSLGDTYGELPTPTRDGYTFAHWSSEQNDHVLPSEYKEVEYVESSFTQYINTGVIPTDSTGVYIRLSTNNMYDDCIYFGARGSENSRFWMGNQLREFYYGWNTLTYEGNITYNGEILEFEFNYLNSRTIKNLNTDYTCNVGTSLITNNTCPIYIFAGNDRGSVTNNSSIKLYELKISEGTDVTHLYVPCYRVSDGKNGLYDIYAEQFYASNGSNELEAGDPVSEIDENSIVPDTKNSTLYAIWIENGREIILNNEDATEAGTTSIYGVHEEKYNNGFYLHSDNGVVSNKMSTTENGITIPKKYGYTFKGYYTEQNGEGTKYIDENGYLTSEANIAYYSEGGTLYAMWIDKTKATVTFDANGGKISKNEQELDSVEIVYPQGEAYTELPTPTRAGYTFDGWSCEQKDYVLPSEYKEVEYIESTGSQYINTGVVPNNTTGMYAKMSSLDISSDTVYFGSRNTMETRFWIANTSGSVYYGWNSNTFESARIVSNQIMEVELNYLNSRKLKNSGTNYTGNITSTLSATDTYPVYLFAANDGGGAAFASKIRIYEFRISQGTEIIHRYIPCYRVSDNEIGLYDVYTGSFYSNSGYGKFNVGNEIEMVDENSIVREEENYTLYANWKNIEANFEYTGYEETYTVPVSGYYKLETWGAQGGGIPNEVEGGYGSYSTGKVYLNQGDTLCINVGQSGTATKGTADYTYNGGGRAYSTVSREDVSSGGGATHIATSSGLLSSFSEKVDELLIVSGGGGGSFNYSGRISVGGSAGGKEGDKGSRGGSTTGGGSQSQGGYKYGEGTAGSFGRGGDGYSWSGGGGAGFYGGGGGYGVGGGGGSGYIGNNILTDKYMVGYNVTPSDDENDKTISTVNVSEEAIEDYAKKGNGYARISYISQ